VSDSDAPGSWHQTGGGPGIIGSHPDAPHFLYLVTSYNGFSRPSVATINYAISVSLADGRSATPAVPEPSAWAMMILGFAGVGAMVYRRRKIAALESLIKNLREYRTRLWAVFFVVG
jgi:hypothetical protein